MLYNCLLVRTNTDPSYTIFKICDEQKVMHFSSGILEIHFFKSFSHITIAWFQNNSYYLMVFWLKFEVLRSV